MTTTGADQHIRELKQYAASNELEARIRLALTYYRVDDAGAADKVIAIVESAVRRRFKLTATEFDLAFTDMNREIEQALDRAIDRDLAVDALVHELAEDEDGDGDDA